MNSHQKMQVKTNARLSPSGNLVVMLKFECASEEVVQLFLRDFSYALDIERRRERERSWSKFPIKRFVIRENQSNQVLWSIDEPREILNILASVSEQGYFTEELLIETDQRQYSRCSNQDVSRSVRGSFRRIIEDAVVYLR